jgi:hypothetical protein
MRTAGGTTERIPFGEKALLWKSRLSDVNRMNGMKQALPLQFAP